MSKKILLIATGSVAAIKTPLLARELRRRGYTVYGFLSDAAKTLITETTMRWACDEYLDLTVTDHIRAVANSDIVVVAPATANTLSKFIYDIADTNTSLLLATTKGSKKPIVFAPAMHQSLFREDLVRRIMDNEVVVPPVFSEGAYKMAEIDEIADYVERELSGKPLLSQKIVVTAGATREYIDDIRFITNAASGKTGIEIAKAAWKKGATVILIGSTIEKPPRYLTFLPASTSREMKSLIEKETSNASWLFMTAAVGDFTVEKKSGKITSEKPVSLHLIPNEKIWSSHKAQHVVLFKALWGVDKEELINIARQTLSRTHATAVVANDLSSGGMGTEDNRIVVVTHKQTQHFEGKKQALAEFLVNLILFDSS